MASAILEEELPAVEWSRSEGGFADVESPVVTGDQEMMALSIDNVGNPLTRGKLMASAILEDELPAVG